jgi:hypothetical protein
MPHCCTQSRGLDVHQDARAVAYAPEAPDAGATYLGAIGTRPGDLDHLTRKLQSKAKPLVFVDEAGPSGYWRPRDLTMKYLFCGVMALSSIPQEAGDRGTTDRRDALYTRQTTPEFQAQYAIGAWIEGPIS